MQLPIPELSLVSRLCLSFPSPASTAAPLSAFLLKAVIAIAERPSACATTPERHALQR